MLHNSFCYALVVLAQYVPTSWAHESVWLIISVSCHFTHSSSRNKIKIFLWSTFWPTKELHTFVDFIIGCHFERKYFNSIEKVLLRNQKFLSVPVVVEVDVLFWVLATSWVSSGDEMSNSSVDSWGSVPEDLVWSTVVHWRWPDGQYCVIWVQSSIVKKSLMLSHSKVKWDVIIFHPATEWMQKEKRILVASFDKLLSGVLKQKTMSIVKRVSNLESVNCISSSFLSDLINLCWSHSILIHSVIEFEFAGESHWSSWDKMISLLPDSANLWVLLTGSSEGLGANFFFPVVEKFWLLNDGNDIVSPF